MNKVVLGGGISGLSAAYYLRKKFPFQKITLLEATNRIGGWIKSTSHEGYIFEQGPRTIRPQGPKAVNTLQLIQDIGLTDDVRYLPKTHPTALNRMIYANRSLHTLPSSFSSIFIKHSPFNKPLIVYLLAEFKQSPKILDDESIYSFIQRRFGTEVADYAISPLICGICAGDAKEVSVRFLMENLFTYEQQYGSITKGILYNMFKAKSNYISPNLLSERAKREKWSVYFFKDGLETLPKHLYRVNEKNNVQIQLNTDCTGIEFGTEATLRIGDGYVKAEHVVCTLSAKKLSQLIVDHDSLKKLLDRIPVVTVCVINLHYKMEFLKNEAFGFLVPPKEKLPILGVIFDSCCFPCNGCTNLTVMVGGHWFKEFFGTNPSKEHLLEITLTQLENILHIKKKPHSYEVNILKDCIPQYVVGHTKTIRDINNYIQLHKLPLSICGTSYNGIGINDAIHSVKTECLAPTKIEERSNNCKEDKLMQMLSQMNSAMLNKLEKNNKKLEESDQKFEETNKKFEETNKKLEETMLNKLEENNQKLEESNQKLEESNQKFEETNKKLEETNKKLEETMLNKLEENNQKLEETNKKLEETMLNKLE
ncbi:hypothetical protein FQA39_LY11259 [Lamprigera yunnana]|nr:hypothetical protein FQA39_LY11259 [Lamprigera yunnana]